VSTPQIRELPDYSGYGVTSDGRVFCRRKYGRNRYTRDSDPLTDVWREMRPGKGVNNYVKARIRHNNGNQCTILVHKLAQQSCVNIAIEADNPTNIITRLSKYVSDETLLKVAAHIRMRSLPKVRFHGVRNDTRFI
jgi:hypothetical protein